jgi:DNA polymerase I-like protein with 3'-5' exonuclease and polymerase domains
MLQKRIGQLSEGNNGWLKLVKKGKLHGRVNPNGAVTGRATHQNPNLGQVPSLSSEYGKECRDLFTVPKGWKLMGADASGLELRCLAHYMHRYDNGEYVDVVLNGDIHTVNQIAAGLPSRADSKRFIYSYLYGGGDQLVGEIVGGGATEGKKIKKEFLDKTPALKSLREAVVTAASAGYIVALDGRRIAIRSPHAALNSLLQSAGALICKQWLVEFEAAMWMQGYTHGWKGDYCLCAWVHDEIQVAVREDIAEKVGNIAVQTIQKVTEVFNLKCPLDGEFNIGNSWAETH